MTTRHDSRDKINEEIPELEFSDETLEAAAQTDMHGLPTLFHLTYCFSCPSSAL